MVNPEELRRFNDHYARNPDEALRLRAATVVVFGVGAVGGFIAAWLARHGVSLLLVDVDRIDSVNLMRFVLSDPKWIGQFKAAALAQQLRAELPSLQVVRSLVANIRTLTFQQFDEMFAQATLVIASTGRTDLDRVLDQWARYRGVPVLFPSLLAGHETFLGDLQVVGWNLGASRRGACFACLRPERDAEPPAADGQQGAAIDVLRVAELTTEVALALLDDTPKRRALVRGLERGVNYFVLPHWPPTPRRVQTTPRTGCPICQTVPASAAGGMRFNLTMRDAVMGGSLVTTILCHQFIPGFDYIATIGAVALAGFWWRGRLPSFEQVADVIGRVFEGR